MGGGEIGLLFPPTDPKFKGIASREIVAEVLKRLKAADGSIDNLDVTVVAEEPKMKPHYAAFRKSLAEIFAVPAERVNVKAKSHEGLGEIGRGEAIACHAVAVVAMP
jgi:2-C-methyl-D-erythritol 4-phosphate cytidylyltransferase/2-C-methyl-D-erythritol 2,4-cyclodiphosphate synthase